MQHACRRVCVCVWLLYSGETSANDEREVNGRDNRRKFKEVSNNQCGCLETVMA